MAELPDLRDFVRGEPVPPDTTVLVRGGPDTASKLISHANRLRRAYVLDGDPAIGISVFGALDDIGPASLDGILVGKLSTYRVVHVVSAGDLANAGFDVLPTFGRPHMTLLLGDVRRVGQLLDLLGAAKPNPRYGEMVHRGKG